MGGHRVECRSTAFTIELPVSVACGNHMVWRLHLDDHCSKTFPRGVVLRLDQKPPRHMADEQG